MFFPTKGCIKNSVSNALHGNWGRIQDFTDMGD